MVFSDSVHSFIRVICLLVHLNLWVHRLHALYFCYSQECIEAEDSWEFCRSEIDVGVQIGCGSYGNVFKGQLKLTAMSPRIFDHKQKMESEGRSHLTIAVKVLRSKLAYLQYIQLLHGFICIDLILFCTHFTCLHIKCSNH